MEMLEVSEKNNDPGQRPAKPAIRRLQDIQIRAKRVVKDRSRDLAHGFQSYVIGPMEKGMEAARLQVPPSHEVAGVDLSVLPKYICYRAALLREKVALQYWLAILSGFFLILIISSQLQVTHLHRKLREKEYIAVPGVQDFVAVSPQSVSESHVINAADAFIQAFGNITPSNIDAQYRRLSESMSDELRVHFELEAAPWQERVKAENIFESLSITQRQLYPEAGGHYRFVFHAKKDSFANYEHLGVQNVVIEMVLKLVAPKTKLWFLEIEKLESLDETTYRAKTGGTPSSAPNMAPKGGLSR